MNAYFHSYLRNLFDGLFQTQAYGQILLNYNSFPSNLVACLQEKASIDGSCLFDLQEKDLQDQLKITSAIIRKKLMKWITKGIIQYSDFLKKQSLTYSGTMVMKESPFKKKQKACVKQEQKEFPLGALTTNLNQSMIQQHHQLIISNLDNTSSMFYSISEQGSKIGRQASNQIVIPDQSISRFHAQILYNNGQFFLRDVGSTTGTFIKINGRLPLELGHIIQMGANQFQITQLNCSSKDSGQIQLNIIDGNIAQGEQRYMFHFQKGQFKTIGRKSTNHIYFTQDQHLSGLHAKIQILDGKFYIEDQCSTNGTWRRLSPQGTQSSGTLLQSGSVFKIGITMSYVCKTKKQMQVVQQVSAACIICCDQQNDCLYMPCKHNVCCFRCSKNMQKCPICKNQIVDIVKMYKS